MASEQHDQWQQQQAQQVQWQLQQQLQQQQQQQQQERWEAEAQGRPMQAPDFVWQELYEQWQLPEWVYDPIGDLEHDMLQLVAMARSNVTYADLCEIAQPIVGPSHYGREHDLQHWLYELLDCTSC